MRQPPSYRKRGPWLRGKRPVVLCVGALALAGASAFALMGHHSKAPTQKADVAPLAKLSTLPGGVNRSPTLQRLNNTHDTDEADAAARAGHSYAAPMAASAQAVADDGPHELGDMSGRTDSKLPSEEAEVPRSPPATSSRTRDNPFGPQPPQPAAIAISQDPPRSRIPDSVALSLLAAWAPKPAMTEIVIAPSDPNAAAATNGGSPASHRESRSESNDASTEASAPQTAAKTMLLQEGHGIYARNILTINSDSGGPVIAEATSGPFVGARLHGKFDRKDDRLVITFDDLVIGDRAPIRISAIALAPDTMETAVASDVDQHYVSRIILPTAAAFVQGLGQAIAQSNSTNVISPLGGVTTAQKLNWPQQVGVAAGAAGQQIGSIIQKAAPSGPTVTLDAGVSLGVMFLAPVFEN